MIIYKKNCNVFFNRLLGRTNLHTVVQNSAPTIGVIHEAMNIVTVVYVITKMTIKRVHVCHDLVKNSFRSTLKSNK